MISVLHHIALGARNVERLAVFYEETFGLALVARHFEGDLLRSIWLELGPGMVLMIERIEGSPSASDEAPRGIQKGPFLLAFQVDRRGRKQFEETIVRRGGEVEERTEMSSYARDPEGNRIAVSHYPLPTSERVKEKAKLGPTLGLSDGMAFDHEPSH